LLPCDEAVIGIMARKNRTKHVTVINSI
jgi:hypothetical protein